MKPSSLLKFLLIVLPLLEIAVFIWVGGLIGAGWTILIILATTLLGISLMRNQGFKMMNQFAQNARAGRAEPADVMEGSFIFIGGFLLIIPGFITDVIGLLCLIPGIRHIIVKGLIIAMAIKPNRANTDQGHRIIEGQFKKKDQPND